MKVQFLLLYLYLLSKCVSIHSFYISSISKITSKPIIVNRYHDNGLKLTSSDDLIVDAEFQDNNNDNNDDDDDDDDDDEAEIGTMRISEIKSELKLRGIDFSDCFDKESLALKLRNARASGKADPSIVDQFNKQRDTFNEQKMEIDDEILEKVMGGDGTLPGGMPPDMLKQLISNPELMTLMQNPKMQDVMKLMMTDGAQALEKAMEEDSEVYEIVTKLNSIMGDTM